MRTTRLLFARPPANFPKWTEGSGRCWLEQWLELTQETRIRSSKDRLHGFCDLGRGFVFVFTSECMTFRASGDRAAGWSVVATQWKAWLLAGLRWDPTPRAVVAAGAPLLPSARG